MHSDLVKRQHTVKHYETLTLCQNEGIGGVESIDVVGVYVVGPLFTRYST